MHVARSNHDSTYKSDCPVDGIVHVYDLTNFEDIVDDLDAFMAAHARMLNRRGSEICYHLWRALFLTFMLPSCTI